MNEGRKVDYQLGEAQAGGEEVRARQAHDYYGLILISGPPSSLCPSLNRRASPPLRSGLRACVPKRPSQGVQRLFFKSLHGGCDLKEQS